MRVGRFNRNLTQVYIEQIQGAANYSIAGELPDGREVEISTPHTSSGQGVIKLTKGDYLVWVEPDVTRLLSYSGQAKVQLDQTVQRLRDGKWIAFGEGRPDRWRPADLPEDLLKNTDFLRGLSDSWAPIDVGEKGRPDVGGQRSLIEESVGNRTMRTLHLFRDTTKDTHNETGLRQQLNRPVWAFRELLLSAWVKISSASLDGGGYAGSEYPLMIRVNYVAENGGSYSWVHGFYVQNSSNRPADLGELIPAREWTYFSLDMNQLRERPAYIESVEVFASGHDFDSQIADLKLRAE
jgi:hypothetical protein